MPSIHNHIDNELNAARTDWPPIITRHGAGEVIASLDASVENRMTVVESHVLTPIT